MNNSLQSLINELQTGFSRPLMKEKNEDAAIKYLLDERKKVLSDLDQMRKEPKQEQLGIIRFWVQLIDR